MRGLVVVAILFLGAVGGEAADRRAIRPAVDEMLKFAGVTKLLAQLPETVIESFEQRTTELDVGVAESRRQILREAYRLDTLYPIVVTTVVSRYDDRHAAAVVRALQTPLFRRLQTLEEAASASGAAPTIRAFSEQLVDHRPSVERHVLIRRLDTAMGVTALQLEVLGATIRGMSRALGGAAPGEAQIRDLIVGVREQSVVPVKNQALLMLLYAYQTAEDDELRDYLAFWESTPGRWFVTTVSTGIVQAMRQAAETAARRLRR